MKAHGEVTGLALRVYTRKNAGFGTPFIFFVDVVGDEDTATLKGLIVPRRKNQKRKFGPALIECVRIELRRHGFKWVRWTRYDKQGNRLRDFKMRI